MVVIPKSPTLSTVLAKLSTGGVRFGLWSASKTPIGDRPGSINNERQLVCLVAAGGVYWWYLCQQTEEPCASPRLGDVLAPNH